MVVFRLENKNLLIWRQFTQIVEFADFINFTSQKSSWFLFEFAYLGCHFENLKHKFLAIFVSMWYMRPGTQYQISHWLWVDENGFTNLSIWKGAN
ncbi:unnamed protein product [Blepharisma stoltei]|uniref:Uncharacterized protein n=1 Tax=Blepharisma stoltei TaxID=1481888 RepID=A0AAU9JK50_9CILI|nr:unnamed protein product [Blepharisma stoltei]